MAVTQRRNKALIIGSSGYVGHAVGRAFVKDGWETYGWLRNPEKESMIAVDEIIPIVGGLDDPSLASTIGSRVDYLNAIIVTVEDLANYNTLLHGIIKLLRSLATSSNKKGVRPLVILTSGMKEYGETGFHGDPGLKPVTEEAAMNPPPALRERAQDCMKILNHTDLFDAALLRPSNLFGLTGSGYGYLFHLAQQAVKAGSLLVLPAAPGTILHSTHVDDCAEAIVSLSKPEFREQVKGQLFQVSGRYYETLEDIGQALVKEYSIPGGVKFQPVPKPGEDLDYWIIGFSQWISSDKIRKTTGWSDRRPSFIDGIHSYRVAFEASIALHLPATKWLRQYVERGQ